VSTSVQAEERKAGDITEAAVTEADASREGEFSLLIYVFLY
jgi:hypothetical protein